MLYTRRFLALLGVAAAAPAPAQAQSDPGADDLVRRLRGAPGSRVGGATRGMKRDQANGTATPAPAATSAAPAAQSPARAATSGG